MTTELWAVFDAVGTLVYAANGIAPVYHTVGQKHGSQLSMEAVRQRFRDAFQAADDDDRRGADALTTSEAREEARWRQIVASVLPDVRDPEACYQELWDHFGQADAWACFDDVASTLDGLAERGVRLAIASNYDRRLHALCDGLPALARIERRIVSSEVGYRKPAAGFFDAVVDVTGVPRSSILFIGDDLENDVRGALRSGLPTVYLCRDGSSQANGTAGSAADVADTVDGSSCRVIPSLLDLLEDFP